jgi:AcrR family transcriptional regulator
MQLFVERGFEQTTALDIAERAGLTERTFFRTFADKREVLFGNTNELLDTILGKIAAQPADSSPMDIVGAAMIGTGEFFHGNRDYVRQRQAVLASTPSLQERELLKLATMATAVADALRARGVPDPSATVAAETGVLVFKIGFQRWVDDDSVEELAQCISETLEQVRGIASTGSATA